LIVTYLDSSALVRLIVREGDVALVEQAMSAGPVSSILAKLEVQAAIYKRWHDREITQRDRDTLLDIAGMLVFSALTFLVLDTDVLTIAQGVIAEYPLRTLDALHVATAVRADRVAKRRGSSLQLCTADRRQAEVAESILGPER
jgi:predicted nucleic acid-binding protein